MERREFGFAALVRLDALPDTFSDRPGTLRRSTRHHHRELFATESRAHIEDAYGTAKDLGDVANHHVACHVSKAIVDALETIEIDHEQCHRCRLADRAMQFLFEAGLEVASVEKDA